VDTQRIEFSLRESSVLVFLPHNLGGLTPEEFGTHLQAREAGGIDLRRGGYFFDVATISDGGYMIRLVQGDLMPEEESEWVAHAHGRLNLPDGKLIVCGAYPWIDYDWSARYDYNMPFAEPTQPNDWVASAFQNIPPAQHLSYYDSPGAYVGVNPGLYRVAVYSYFPDLSADWGIPGLSPELRLEEQKDYFERTRPGKPLPDWMEGLSAKYINFVVHLTPVDKATFDVLIVTDPQLNNGWELRKPAVCPSALLSELGTYMPDETDEDEDSDN
jgi:hypothetical protein